ncbi:MAG: site-specific DNA-methyltransferase, partial [Ruminococcus sp.]|nr:site-specific DNA-methyltransferase [Ruminococcus sp.]
MDRPNPESKPLCSENVDKIGSLFPDCIVETTDPDGSTVRRIDMEMLSRLLSDDAAEPPEVYEFTWVGKKAAARAASAPAAGKLIPCAEESVDWENTRNLYIEGDNLEVLKLLREEYAGGVKVIYIDPPYNTGKKYVYRN